ncbi:hypothetical protein BGZ96_006809 [Linnemannia gamsii]|uniref:DUF221-domain-containing protein n=1 Tax=Linnemannia gamsii TaxID=64522 RepID=A0ABQ7K2N6_9FUNG|nr:hypothetical protein BGZ96_006809 [Linnemannia gamsii]
MSSIFDAKAGMDKLQPSALAVNLGTNIALSLLTLGAFCWLRPKNGVIYARKYKASPEEKRAPKLAEGYFAWMSPVWNCPDTELVEKIGLDAVVFIRFIRMCRQILIALAVLGCGTLIPINIIGTIRSQNGVVPEDKIGLLTISGIRNFDWLWAHVGAIWAFSTVFGLAILHGYRTFLKFRIQYFESDTYQESMASRTLMLAGLPDSLQDDEKLSTFMSNLGTTDQPVQALVGRKVNKLPELMAEHKKMVTSLEKIMAKYFADPNKLPEKRPTVRLGHFFGTKVDAIDYYSQKIEELSDKIDETRLEISTSQATNYGFVSYQTIQGAHKVAKEFTNSRALRTRSKMLDPPELFLSPVPKDIIWFNVSNPKHLRKSRRVIVNVLFFVGSLLFFIPMGLLTAFAKLDRFIGLFPQTKPYFDRNPFVTGLVQSLLPILALDILMLLVRKLIVYLAWFQGNITKSSTDRSTVSKFYLFFTLNNLIVFALSGTILGFFTQIKLFLDTFQFNSGTWEAIKQFIKSQDNIVEVLSNSVVDTSLFWVNYMSLRNFGVLLDLSQLVSLAIYWLKSTVTPRESKALDKPDVFDFPLFFSVHLFALTVTLLYSVISPLILFFAAIYFSLSSLAYKYQLMYVFRTKVETGGRLFRVVYNRLLAALILFQIVMIGVLNLKTAHRQSLAIIPLPILTILFKIFLSKTYDPKIDFYDYGTSRTDLRRTNSKSGKTLSSTFENPALTSKMISALVPDGAKKMLSSKILHGGRDNLEEDAKKSNKGGRPAYNKQNSSKQGSTTRNNTRQQESYEMGHVTKPAKTYSSHHKNSYDSTRPLSPLSGGGKQEYGADDFVDDYFDNQKQSLTKAAAQPRTDYNNPNKLYGAQDMTSFVAGRYRANEDPYGFNNNSNSNSTTLGATGATNKPSYMELAKQHQTDSYKTTGKAMQYEDTNALQALHLPPINFQKPKTRRQQPQQQEQQQQQQHVSDSYDEITVQDQDNHDYVEYYVEPATSPKASSRMPKTAPVPRRRDRDNTGDATTTTTTAGNSNNTSRSNTHGRQNSSNNNKNDTYTSQGRNITRGQGNNNNNYL